MLERLTALRLFYGNLRLSEDLDFVLKEKKFDLIGCIPKIKAFTEELFPFIDGVKIDVQKNDSEMQRLILATSSVIHEQRIRVHLELMHIPSYLNKPRILNFPPLNPVVRVEEAVEILADKIVAMINRPYIKGRDIWDIYFLVEEKDIASPIELIMRKAGDYSIKPARLREKIDDICEKMRKEGTTILTNEMLRFLPKNAFDQYKGYFANIVDRVTDEIKKVRL
jgi:predicted nucleotidyltransferase component of viral defense system